MDIGSFFLAWSTVPLILSMAGYLLVAGGRREFRLSAGTVYWLLFGMVAVSFVYLYYAFVTDQFQYSYVTSYSSSDLPNRWPHFYKVSALWAGQQGTFLLWLLFGVILGFWVKAKAKENEGWVMFFYILGQTFLLVLTLISNPFEKLQFIPADGQGLNPLLQNYWMQIHPPIVFVGFAAACIPFAFAMAALATNKYNNWVKETMPWTVFTVVTLGLGIFLGGYWAYETLGWGGYWAWDPVENASLIPWLVSIALVHGMVVEKSRGTWRRTNIFLAITLFLLIVYGTFLTRSGVLADFSVHSFTDLGYNNILWASILILGAISYGLWGYRSYKMKVPSASGTEILSQEFSTFLSMVLLLPFTFLVLFWTSFPLVTTILSKIPLISEISPTPAAIDGSNYNMVGLIFSIIFCVILGFNSLLGWKKTEPGVIGKKLIIPSVIAIVSAAFFIIFGYSKMVHMWSPENSGEMTFKVALMLVLYFLFSLTSVFALITNAVFLITRWKSGIRLAGGYITHVGFSIMLIGIIFTSSFGSRQKATISLGESKSVLDYSVMFASQERSAPKEERSSFELTRGDKIISAYNYSKEMIRGNQIQFVRTPFIHKYLLSDLYLSVENLTNATPKDLRPFDLAAGESIDIFGTILVFERFDSENNLSRLAKYQPSLVEVKKGETVTIDGKKVKFVNFEMSEHQGGMGSAIGAILNIDYKGKTETITPYYVPSEDGTYTSPPVDFPGGGRLSMVQIKADVRGILLSYSKTDDRPAISVGTEVAVVAGGQTSRVLPKFNLADPHSATAEVEIPGGILHLLSVDARRGTARFEYHPEEKPILATIELSTKPMINLVWVGFLLIVIGSAIAFFRRIGENKSSG